MKIYTISTITYGNTNLGLPFKKIVNYGTSIWLWYTILLSLVAMFIVNIKNVYVIPKWTEYKLPHMNQIK